MQDLKRACHEDVVGRTQNFVKKRAAEAFANQIFYEAKICSIQICLSKKSVVNILILQCCQKKEIVV